MPSTTRGAVRPTKRAYRALVQARLKELRPALVKELRERVFVFPVPQGATSLDFEVSQAVDGVPVRGYFMDDNAGQVFDSIAVTSRHRSMETLRGYIQRETIHERGAGEELLRRIQQILTEVLVHRQAAAAAVRDCRAS